MINRKYLVKILAWLVATIVLMFASWHFGKMHAIEGSYIYEENGYYVIELDGEEYLHFAPDVSTTEEQNSWK